MASFKELLITFPLKLQLFVLMYKAHALAIEGGDSSSEVVIRQFVCQEFLLKDGQFASQVGCHTNATHG